ncbi:MAG: PKD domain-containing protein [Bacteroidota bacterium]
MKHLWNALLLSLAVLLVSSAALAQVRADNTFFLQARVGLTTYGGDIDNNPDNEIGTYLENGDIGFGGELGYQFSPGGAISLAYLYGSYPNTLTDFADAPIPSTVRDSDVVQEVQLRLRLTPFGGWRIAPFVTLGGSFAFATPGNSENDPLEDFAYGPLFGGGLDIQLTGRLALVLEGDVRLFFPDGGIDGSDPSNATIPVAADESDFDALGFLGGGVRFTFKSPITKVDAMIDGPMSLEAGQTGTFSADVNPDATGPLSFGWDWGDGSTSTGLIATHTYSSPGAYTVTFTATGPANTDVETMTVEVTTPPAPPAQPPVLANCTATPGTASVGEAVRFSATVTGTTPISFRYDFGDGGSANTLNASHTYNQTGTYTVTLTSTNEAGTDQCTFVVNVADRFCQDVSELNTVFFDYSASALNSEAQSRLDENIEVLERCPDLCVIVNGYTDDREGNKLSLSEQRATAVAAYYVQSGIDQSRIQTRGLGEAPDSNSKEDPGPGDRNARRAESLPVGCSALGN